jgi:small subunit ribosomal protein S1
LSQTCVCYIFTNYHHCFTPLPLQAGDVILGTVQDIESNRAYVDLGDGVTGLLHIYDISGEKVEAVEEILLRDDKIMVGP